jgi:luciferase family oxidoreductase group 1
LPFAFASHFAPDLLTDALGIYRSRFKPSAQRARPHAMLGINIIAAETDARAGRLFTSLQQAFINLRRGRPGKLPAPAAMDDIWSPMEKAQLDHALVHSIVGSPETVRTGVASFIAAYQPDELMITAQIHDHAARLASYEIVAESMALLNQRVAA